MSKNITAAEYIQANSRYAYKFGGSLPKLDTYAVWEVRGADPNCDLGGSHHTPLIGYYEGKFEDVFNLAKTKSSCYGWGGFEAEFQPIEAVKVDSDSVKKQNKLLKEKEDIEKRLKEISTLLP